MVRDTPANANVCAEALKFEAHNGVMRSVEGELVRGLEVLQ